MLEQKTLVFDANLQKYILLDFNQKSKIKSQEYSKSIADKKALMTIIYGQCNEVTKTKIALGASYTAYCNARRLSTRTTKASRMSFTTEST